jgi:RNA polymerase sigma factor (sigma-70 family)
MELDADDAVAEGLSRALRRIDQLRDPAAVEAWMLRSVVRCAIDLSRRRRRQRTIDAADALTSSPGRASESAAEAVITAMEHDSMAEALGCLEPGIRLLLYLRYEACLSIQHIALTLDRPAGTIRRQCVEARRLAGQQFLGRHVRPASGPCAQVTEVLCRSPQRPPAIRVRQRTAEHLRRCRACRDRQNELTDVLAELGCRPPRHEGP